MRPNRTRRGFWKRTGLTTMAIGLLIANGGGSCDLIDIYRIWGSATTISLNIPLGLDGGTGILNPGGSGPSGDGGTGGGGDVDVLPPPSGGGTTPPVPTTGGGPISP